MPKLPALLFVVAALSSPQARGAELGVSIGTIQSPSWTARGVRLDLRPPDDIQLSIAAVEVSGQPPLRDFRLRCKPLHTDAGVHCDRADFELQAPVWGRVRGGLRAHFVNAQRWQAELDIPARQLQLALDQRGATLDAALKLKGFNFSNAAGTQAAEHLDLDARLRWQGSRWQIDLSANGGQAYVDPLFLDFSALPLRASATLMQLSEGWRIERAEADHGAVGRLAASGLIDKTYRARALDLRIEAGDLARMLATYGQPFLIGSRLDDLTASGRTQVQVSVRDGAVQQLTATLAQVDLRSERLGLEMAGLAGNITWPGEAAAPSTLRWQGGAVRRIPLGPSDIVFRAKARGFELLQAWRQPLLDGALSVQRLALDHLGEAQMSADFEGAVEPIDLPALCKALGWPTFPGTLAGTLPGLRVRDDVWTIDGALEANVFDGSIRIGNLRALQPFGNLPRVMADLQLRRLDLERLTGAFSFGRITGRLDGDVSGLRLLNWRPVAFDGRLYSTPGDRTRRRISQRAIDSISSIGGGPTGVLARGFLSVFDDFAYDRLGLSCVLRDGVCAMDGVEPATSKTDQRAYYIVKGRLLPRIDVVGYAQQVSWNNLLNQLQAAQASGGPQLGQQAK